MLALADVHDDGPGCGRVLIVVVGKVIARKVGRRRDARQITLFDGTGFATEGFSALRYVRHQFARTGFHQELDMIAGLDDHRVLYGMIRWAIKTAGAAANRRLSELPATFRSKN